MADTIIVALLSLAGTLIGSAISITTNSKMVQYRLQQLEDKVAKHNNVVERTYILEGKMEEAQHYIKDLERKIDNV